MEYEVIKRNSELDYQLCRDLGEGSSDFIVVYLDGEVFEGFGTPFDSPKNRVAREEMVKHLNDRSKDSWWPELFCNWKSNICTQFKLPPETTSDQFHPVASLKVHRVCCGYSEHLHAAIRLFETQIAYQIDTWSVGKLADGIHFAEVISKAGREHREVNESLSLAIALVAQRLVDDVRPVPNMELSAATP